MNTNKILFIAFGCILSANFLLSCAKTKSSIPSGTLHLQFQSVKNNLALNTIGNIPQINLNLMFTEGFLNVSEVYIEGVSRDEVKNEIERNNENSHSTDDYSSVVNLFTPNKKFVNLNVASGNCSNVKIRIDIAQKSAVPALFLKGTFTDGKGNQIPVQYSLNEGSANTNLNGNHDKNQDSGEDDDLEMVVFAKALNVTAKNTATATVNLDFKLLLNGVTDAAFETATRVNGQIVVNKTTNRSIYNIVKANIMIFSKID